MPGVVEALVIDNVDPEQLGRVKVKFPSLPEAPESYWARLVSPMAGVERGWVTLPEPDDEVLVAFMHGDFNHAVVLGGLYNGVDTPPYANEDGDNNLKVFQSRSGHRVTFDDTAGSERIEMISHNQEIKVVWDASGKTLSVYCGKDIIIEAGNAIDIKCKDFMLKADQSISIDAGQTMKLKAGQAATIDGGQMLNMKAATINLN